MKNRDIRQQIEKLRWMNHQNWLMGLPDWGLTRESYNNNKLWWCEVGAFVSVLPRQVGKTHIINKLTGQMAADTYFVLIPSLTWSSNYRDRGFENVNSLDSFVTYIEHGGVANIVGTNLFVDEYQCCKKEDLDKLMNYPWKSLSLFGTLV